MALTSTFISNPVKTIIVNQTVSTSAAGVGDNNVAGGPVYLLSAKITGNTADVYTKLYNLTSAVAGTSTADVVMLTKANTTKIYTFHPPLYFSNGLSTVTTTTAGQAGTTAPQAPPGLHLVLSTSAS